MYLLILYVTEVCHVFMYVSFGLQSVVICSNLRSNVRMLIIDLFYRCTKDFSIFSFECAELLYWLNSVYIFQSFKNTICYVIVKN